MKRNMPAIAEAVREIARLQCLRRIVVESWEGTEGNPLGDPKWILDIENGPLADQVPEVIEVDDCSTLVMAKLCGVVDHEIGRNGGFPTDEQTMVAIEPELTRLNQFGKWEVGSTSSVAAEGEVFASTGFEIRLYFLRSMWPTRPESPDCE